MTPYLFDSHCHFDFPEFDDQRQMLWQQCRESGIQRLLIPGVYPNQWKKASQIAEKYSGIYIAAGLHPWWVGKQGEMNKTHCLEVLQDRKCIAIGECGMDAAIDTPLDQQQAVFEQHLAMSVDCAMPLMVHVRQTHNETIRLLKHYRPAKGGVIHGFTGSLELAQAYWQLGFYLGVGGSITYPRAKKTHQTVQQMPLESLLLETDAPDMPLYGYQGQPNSPLKLVDIAKKLGELRQQPVAQIAQITTQNALKLFAF